MSLAAWLRAGRDRRNLTIEDVAKITKIQVRILEKLESGSFDGLPAEVFVKGFVRSFAKCVGLDESEAISKYSAALAQGTIAVAKALVDTMGSSVRRIESPRGSSPGIVLPPVEAAPSEAAPAEAAPVEVASAVELPRVEAESVAAAPATDAPATRTSSIVEAVVAVEMAAQTAHVSKKKKRKNAKQRARNKKKLAQQELASAEAKVEHAIENATTAVFAKQAMIETGPVAKIDGESAEAMSIEAKTNDSLDVVREDGVVESPVGDFHGSSMLAEGSGPIAQATVAVDRDASEAAAPASDETRASDETSASDALTSATNASPSVTNELSAATDELSAATDELSPAANEPSPETNTPSTATNASSVTESESAIDASATSGTWQPTMPPITAAPSVPWRRPSLPTATATASAYVVPTLVIDDADPDSADREREDRIAKEPQRISFLPPILLDREDRSSRQGGLTLAVILLLIAATLTLSYLMRRPSPSGDGVTMLDGSSMLVG